MSKSKSNETKPPELDVASGRLINPHNPEFIMKVRGGEPKE